VIIKLKDYERIYKTINSIILSENSDPTTACTFFSCFGAYILASHYRINATPVAGMCMYHLGGEKNILTYGSLENGIFTSNMEAFHCWILADGWLIDFMAPTFPTPLRNSGQKFLCAPKMMQKPISKMAKFAHELEREGDFYFEINPHITNERQEYISSSLAYSDLANISKDWYKKPPKNMLPKIQISNGKGALNSISLTGNSVIGAW
jgi:hypothetical protein